MCPLDSRLDNFLQSLGLFAWPRNACWLLKVGGLLEVVWCAVRWPLCCWIVEEGGLLAIVEAAIALPRACIAFVDVGGLLAMVAVDVARPRYCCWSVGLLVDVEVEIV